MSWEYIAGFIDGEGSIVKKNQGYKLYISQTNFEVLERIRKFTGVGYVYTLSRRKAHWKDNWLYAAGDMKGTRHVLLNVVDKLIVKRGIAKKAIVKLTAQLAKMEKLYQNRQERIRKGKVLRAKGWTYREIAKTFNTDFSYIRRLLLKNK